MLKLMRLEMKKFRLFGFIIGALITMVGIFGMIFLIVFSSVAEGALPFADAKEAVDLINTLVNDAYLIFAAVMLSKFIIGEYQNKTVNLLFTYPIHRKKLIYAKLLLVYSFLIVTMIAANVIILGAFYLLNLVYEVLPLVLTGEFMIFVLLKVILYSISFACISSLSLYIGMMKKSQAATIVSSIIVVSVLGSTSNGFSLSSITIIPVTVAAIGVLMTYLTFRRVEYSDI